MLFTRSKPKILQLFAGLIFFNLTVPLPALKLNTPNLLLNSMYDLPTNYTLIITEAAVDDCFEWHSADTSLVSVTTLFDSSTQPCSKMAIVSSVGNETSIRSTRITATRILNKGGAIVKLYCDVFTDVPKTIELETVSNEIVIDGAWMKISVVAKNEMGHVFDSINGIQFVWNLSCSSEENEIVRLRMFSESNYTAEVDNDAWEIRGLLSTSVLAEGVDVGTCTITASMVDFMKRKAQYHVLSTSPIEVKVSPNVQVHPSSVLHILRHSAIRLEFRTKDGNSIDVDSTDSSVSVSVPDVISISKDLMTITGKTVGHTNLIYKSHSNKFPEMLVELHVTEPDSLELEISRGAFTVLEEMKSYFISVKIRANEKRITPSDNLRIKVKFPSKLFHVNTSSDNGTYYFVQTLAPGSGTITAEYKGHVLSDGTVVKGPPLTTSIKVRVCHKLQIFPPFLMLPTDSETDPLHEVTLRVSGGSNHYSWGLNNKLAASLILDEENNNVVKVQVHKEAVFTVSATDINNINFIATATVSIQPVVDIEIYSTVVEAEIGNTLLLPVALLGYECKEKKIIRKFDDCSRIPPTVEIVDKHILSYDNEPYIPAFGKGCLTLQFRCNAPGHSRINIYHASNKSANNETLKTTTVLACFKHLKPIHPVRVAVLALGTSKEIAFEGGPRKWPLHKEGHYTKLEASNPNLVSVELVRDPIRYNRDLTVFRVLCKSLGETVLLFQIGNEPSATIPHPANSEASIKLVCSIPNSVHLKVHKKSERAKKEDDNIVKVPFYGDKIFSVDMWVKDAVGRKFCNISSFQIEWGVSDKTLAQPAETYSGVTTHENAVAGFRKVSRDFKEFKMSGGTGELKVSAKLTGYRQDVLSKENIQTMNLQEVSKSIDLKLISLRDMNTGLYPDENNNKQEEEMVCDGDSCKS